MSYERTIWTTIQAGVPTVLSGPPGIGKTSSVTQFAHKMHRESYRFGLIGMTYEDLVGYYKVVRDRYTKRCPHTWAVKLRKQPYLVILDEINRVDERVQNAVSQFLDKSLGQFQLHPETWFVGTMNPEGGGVFPLNENLINRCALYDVDLKSTIYTQLMTMGFDHVTYPIVDQEKYKEKVQEARNLLLSFHYKLPSVFNPEHIDQTRPWPCPRTIENLTKALGAALAADFRKVDDVKAVATACCGQAFGIRFAEYYKDLKLPDIREVLAMIHSGAKLPGDRSTIVLLLLEVCRLIKQEEEYREHLTPFVKYLVNMINDFGDVVAYIVFELKELLKEVRDLPYRILQLKDVMQW